MNTQSWNNNANNDVATLLRDVPTNASRGQHMGRSDEWQPNATTKARRRKRKKKRKERKEKKKREKKRKGRQTPTTPCVSRASEGQTMLRSALVLVKCLSSGRHGVALSPTGGLHKNTREKKKKKKKEERSKKKEARSKKQEEKRKKQEAKRKKQAISKPTPWQCKISPS